MVMSLASLTLLGCGKGFQIGSSLDQQTNHSNAGSGTPEGPCITDCGGPTIEEERAAAKAELQATISGSAFDGAMSVDLDWITKSLVIIVPLPGIDPLMEVLEGNVPGLSDAFYTFKRDATGNWRYEVHIPLNKVLGPVDPAESKKLPNGDALPGVPGGELPEVAFSVKGSKNNWSIFLYAGSDAAAVFIPTPFFNPTLQLTFPLRNSEKTRTVGYFSTIPKKGTANPPPVNQSGGFYVSVAIPADLARWIDDLR